MKTFNQIASQGDVRIERVSTVPPTHVKQDKFDGVLANSESQGHHHYLGSIEGAVYFREPGNATVAFLRLEQPISLDHNRVGGHNSIALSPGTYRIVRQREFVSPEETRLLED